MGERAAYVDRSAQVRELAPVAPPCFVTRGQWISFLSSAAEYQRDEHAAGPLLFEAGKPVRFDPNYSYCADCDMSYRSRMLKEGRCNPSFVRQQFARERLAVPGTVAA